MAINERAKATIELDGQQAQNELQQLKAQAAQMRKEIKQLRLDKDPGYGAKKKEFDTLQGQISRLTKSSFDLNATLKNLSGATIKDLTRAQSVLSAQIRQTDRSTRAGQAAFAQKTEQLRKIRAEMALVRGQMTGLSQNMSLLQKASDKFNKYFGLIGATVATFSGVILGMRSTIQVFNDFEESVANLSALTGLAGDQLDWLSDRAKQASISTSESGIRFSNSAKEIVDAFTMVGSKRPELLANREALALVTEQAMVLSKAAKIDLEPAATALTTTMNQFNESADQAQRIINILGAGSKVGAGNVAYLNDVVEKSGTSAKGAGLSIEQLVGTIEGIAPKFSEPARAGTMLRNVFVRLQNIDDQLNPTIVGWDKSLENLAKRQYSTAEITKLFGLESFTMVQALIDGRADIVRYTEAVTGSSIALEQAAINSDTNAARLDQARNRAQLLRIELGEKMAPALTFSTNSFSYLLKTVKDVIDNWEKYRRILLISAGVLMAYSYNQLKATAASVIQNLTMQKGIGLRIKETVTTQAQIIREAALTGWRVKGSVATKAATATQRVFNAVVSQFPGFAILGAIMAIIGAIKLWDTHNKAAVERRKEHDRLMGESNLLLKNANYLSRQSATELTKLNTLTVEQKNSLAQANREKIRSIEADLQQILINKQLAKENAASVSVMQGITASLKSIVSGKHAVVHMAEQSTKNMTKAGEEFNETISQMQTAIDSLHSGSRELENILTAESRAGQIAGDSLNALQEKINLYTLALEHAKIGSEDYIRIKTLLTQTQKQLSNINQESTETVNVFTDAYRELTRAISEAQAQMQHLVATGNYSGAQAMQARINALEAEKIVIDGIVESGGDVIAFLDNMADSTQAELEEMALFQQQFLDQWQEKSLDWEQQKQEQHDVQLKQEIEDYQNRLKRKEWEAEREKQLAEEVAQAKQQVTDATLSAGFNMFSMYANAELDRELKDMELQRERQLANDYLSAEQRQDIAEKFQKEEAKIKKESFIRQKKADVIQAIINTALAVSRALPDPIRASLAGVLGAIQVATIAAQPVPQFFKGRYPVKGLSDGRTYMATLSGQPVTGIYTSPALIAERGEELIVDAPTTKNIRMNHPYLLNAILSARVPQYASGRYPETKTSTQTIDSGISSDLVNQIAAVISENNKTMKRMIDQIDQGITANVSLTGYNGFYEKDEEYKRIKKNAYS